MRRLFLIMLLALGGVGTPADLRAQSTTPQLGDPPVLARITISVPSDAGIVTINAANGAVFPNAYVLIRNLYTGATASTRASSSGSFSAQLYGPGNTPFWISPSPEITSASTVITSGSLPGGPGVILYGGIPAAGQFTIDGRLSAGDTQAIWSAVGHTETLSVEPGAAWRLTFDISVNADLPTDLSMIGRIGLQPIARSMDGTLRAVGGVGSNNGWSSILTPSGIAIDNLRSAIPLGEAVAQPYQFIRDGDTVSFSLDFAVTLPDDLPPGLYVPVFEGTTQKLDGVRQAWDGDAASATRLPLVINVGEVNDVRLPFALFYDAPSDGSRGILPDEDQGVIGLSNRVRFDSPIYILPPFEAASSTPISYPLEPYLPNELANRYDTSSAPLIPFTFPSGSLQVSVTKPDGTVDDFGNAPLAQNQLSTAAEDERALFGAASPVDMYRLTTRNPRLAAYTFTQYGDYTINLTGSVRDVWGNRYTGGGVYHVVAAEPLDLTPGVLSGTPFEVGDAFNLGLHLAPGVPADVTVTVRVYPLDGGSVIERVITGRANRNGYFQPDDTPFVLTTPGEYVIDYQARYLAPDNRLWAASLRGAGVIAVNDSDIIAHGERSIPAITSSIRPAWFDLREFAQVVGTSSGQTPLNFPYQSGDVAWVGDSSAGGMAPEITVQDRAGAYADALIIALPDYVGEAGRRISALAAQQELPLRNGSYGYVSAVRPNASVRQFVASDDDGGLPLYWDEDDPLNHQIGAGINGDRPGDFIFLFGGAVIRTETQDAEGTAVPIRDTAIYGALAVVTDADEPPRIYPPGRGTSGGADGGALLIYNGKSIDTFVNLTALQPGDVLRLGNTIGIAGEIAPPLPAAVTTTFTSPSGRVTQFANRANAVGYFYDPAARFTVDDTGLWMVDVQVTLDSATSAGQAVPPLIHGGVLGADGGHFPIYVLPQNSEPLDWNPLLADTIIPVVSPYNFSFTLPQNWSNIHAYYTLSTPGMILEQNEIRVFGRNFSYQYSPPSQSRTYPNLENEGRVSGAYVSDTRTLTFVATGIDSLGVAQIRSRTFTLMHDRLITLE